MTRTAPSENRNAAAALVIKRPFLDPKTVMAVLDIREFQLNQLIESGALKYVFNIGRSARRAMLRILLKSVVFHTHPMLAGHDPGLEAILEEEIPKCSTMKGTAVARLLTVDSMHVCGLMRDGELRGTHRGEGRTPAIRRDSLIEFLMERRWLG